MNLDYDLITWVNYFIGAFVCCFSGIIVGKILLNKKFKDIKLPRYFLIIPFSIFLVFNNLAFDNILKMFGSILVLSLIYRYILEQKGVKIFTYSMASFVIFLLGELSFALVISLFDYLFHLSLAHDVSKAVYSNILIAIFYCIMTYIFRKKLAYYLEKIDKVHIFIAFFQGLLTLFITFSSLNFLYIEKWQFSYKFILIFIIMIGSATITISLVKQYLNNKEVVEKYKMSEEYLKTSALLIEKYSTAIHRYKNNLIILKGYIRSNEEEANQYIDSLLDKFEDKKYSWVKKINYIPIDTMRYVIYYKLSKAEEKNLKIFVNVSRDIKKNDSKILESNQLGHILDILGEYFDNAIYASFESKEKELIFDLYQENDNMIFKISNTFKGNIDLNMITKNGYTTKGKGHGLGLFDIDKIIKNINILNNIYEIIDNYFVTTLTINLKDNKKSVKK